MPALLPSRSSSDETAFAYKPLSAEADTRLIELEPAPDASSPLRCRIADLCLSSDDLVEYEALSYTWGAPDFTETLYVIEHEDKTNVLKITTNLKDALQRIRLRDQKRLLWVDAVCINQKDSHDKEKQIPAMARIFSAASRVLVWLGTSPQGQIALADIKKGLSLRNTDSTRTEAQLSSLTKTFQDLVALPWFSRRWIIQEVVLAADVLVLCGPDEIPMTRLFRVLNDLLRKSETPPALAPLAAISRLWKTWVFDSNPEGGLRLIELLLLFQDSDCQVGLDRIYALCNLASDCVIVDQKDAVDTNKISIVVDYSQTAECLYQSVVDQILGVKTNGEGITRRVRGHYNVEVPGFDICREIFGAVVERCDGVSRNAKAWVPDWRLPKKREPIFKSLDAKRKIGYSRSAYLELVDPERVAQHDSPELVDIVLEPFPEYISMTEIKNWLQAMRDRFADYQRQFPKNPFFLYDRKLSLKFLLKYPFLASEISQRSLDGVWCLFLSIVLDQGMGWQPRRDGRNVVEDNARNLYLLSLGESEMQISYECWSFLDSLFIGRRIFFL